MSDLALEDHLGEWHVRRWTLLRTALPHQSIQDSKDSRIGSVVFQRDGGEILMQKLAALSGFLGAGILVATTIVDLINSLEKIRSKTMQRSPIVDQENRAIQLPESTLINTDRTTHRIVDNDYPRKTRQCRICEVRGYTEWHHIISQGHARKTNQHRLLTNPGNVVELCKKCHNQTTASKSWYSFENKKKNKKKTNRLW